MLKDEGRRMRYEVEDLRVWLWGMMEEGVGVREEGRKIKFEGGGERW